MSYQKENKIITQIFGPSRGRKYKTKEQKMKLHLSHEELTLLEEITFKQLVKTSLILTQNQKEQVGTTVLSEKEIERFEVHHKKCENLVSKIGNYKRKCERNFKNREIYKRDLHEKTVSEM